MIGPPGRKARPVHGPAAVLFRVVRMGTGVNLLTTWQGWSQHEYLCIASTDEWGGSRENDVNSRRGPNPDGPGIEPCVGQSAPCGWSARLSSPV